MSDFEKGFNEELAKIAQGVEGYTPEEVERLEQIMKRDFEIQGDALKGALIGTGAAIPAGAGLGALLGRGARGRGALIGGAAGLAAGPVLGTTANLLRHGSEMAGLSREARGIAESKTPEQVQAMRQHLWSTQGRPKL